MNPVMDRECRSSCRFRNQFIRILTVTSLVLALPGCGGGGGTGSSSSPAGAGMTASPQSISVTATTTQPAPTRTVVVNFYGTGNVREVYIGIQHQGNGINQVVYGGGYLPADVIVELDSPAQLGPGTYNGSISIVGCLDSNCNLRVNNGAAIIIPVQYIVTKSTFSLSKISPSSSLEGAQPFNLTVHGTSFTQQSKVVWNNEKLSTTYVSSSELTAQVTASDIATSGNVSVTVNDPTNGTTNAVPFSIKPVTGTITSLSPDTGYAGSYDVTLTVNGSYFTPESSVYWDGTSLPTTYVSSSQLLATVAASDFSTPGTVSVSVNDPASGTTNAMPFSIESSPVTVTSLSPDTDYAGSAGFTLTVIGSGFTSQSKVRWNQSPQTTTFVSATELTALIPASEITSAGTDSIAVNDTVYGTSNALPFNVASSPVTITSLSPPTVYAGGRDFTLTVNGSGFTAQSTVLWNGDPNVLWVDGINPVTFVNSTQLRVRIPASEITSTGSDWIAVYDPVYGTSNSQSLTVTPASLALSSISPTSVTAGGPSFTLTVLGDAFTGTSVVKWNGAALSTTKVSPTELTAQVPASDISTTGTASLLVSDPNSPPGTTTTQTLTIAAASKDAVAYQINPEHNGAVTFSSVSAPTGQKWSVDLGGTPSYAIIADGEVIVTVKLPSGGSEVLALDQATGNTTWGPILLTGLSFDFTYAAYDNARVFVLSGSSSSDAAIMQAFDAATGTKEWATNLTGRADFTGLLTASDGAVYVESESNMEAVAESNGELLWHSGADGVDLPTAVTADGVYTSFSCATSDWRPATGELIWYYNAGCSGAGNDLVPVLTNQTFYAPNTDLNYSGKIFDSETGTSEGAYTADTAPAFTSTMGFFLQNGTLNAVKLSDDTVQWSYSGDGSEALVGAPIVVNQYVFIGSSTGHIYMLDSTSTGPTITPVWSDSLSAAIDTSPSGGIYSGLSAGDGLLVVPSENTITAYTLSTSP